MKRLLPSEEAHQVADRRVVAEADQRAEVVVDEGFERAAGEAAADWPEHVAASWWAAWARAGPGRGAGARACAQSPMAKTSGSRVVCERRRARRAGSRGRPRGRRGREHVGAAHAGGPDHELGGDEAAVGEPDAVGRDFADAGVGEDLDAELG